MLKFIHAADFHLDSPFGALTAQQAAARRNRRLALGRQILATEINGLGGIAADDPDGLTALQFSGRGGRRLNRADSG